MKGLWKLVKWAKNKSPLSKELPKMPPLHSNGMTANTLEEKAEMLKEVLFPLRRTPTSPTLVPCPTLRKLTAQRKSRQTK